MTKNQPAHETTSRILPQTAADQATAPARSMTCIISSQLRPGDRQALLDLFERSSPQSRRDRFQETLSVFPRRYLDDILAGRQLAVVARDTCHPHSNHRVLGLASAAPAGDGEAEFAVWTEDACQGRGVGSLLLRTLLRRLAEQGTAVGIIEPGNQAMRRLVAKVAPEAVTRHEDGMIVARIPPDGGPGGKQSMSEC
jgi:GNAT superfamily N-acetyltransferase